MDSAESEHKGDLDSRGGTKIVCRRHFNIFATTCSIPARTDVLSRSMSGYKLNVSKTQALAFNYEPTKDITEKYQFKWSPDSIKYLGVYITKNLANLPTINFGLLTPKIKADIRRWNLVPFLTVESVKMNTLPRLLYLFQTLLVEVTTQQFVE